jgi:hypothetical protein
VTDGRLTSPWHHADMDLEDFWAAISTARAACREGQPFHQALTGHLATLPPDDLVAYQARFRDLRARLYRWDVWAAAYLIGGGCSDDGFIDFRAGLIAQGRGWYERTAASPDDLADHPDVRSGRTDFRDESVNYAAVYAYEATTGGSTADFYSRCSIYQGSLGVQRESDMDMGEDFDFDSPQQMRRHLPRLSAIFLPDDIPSPPRRRLLG